MNKLSIILKAARIRKGLSVDDFSRRSGISRTEIYRFENGERDDPRLSTLVALANALDMTIDELVGRAELSRMSKEDALENTLFDIIERLDELRPRRTKRK